MNDGVVRGHWVFRLRLNTDDPDEIARNLRLVADHVEARSMRADQHAKMFFRDAAGREIGTASFDME